MALNFPIPTSVGQVYQDPTSGNTYVCTSLGPPAQWVGSGSSTSLDSTYLRTDASNDPVTGNLLLNPTTNVSPLTLQQPVGNTTPALKIENSGSGNSIEANGFAVSQIGIASFPSGTVGSPSITTSGDTNTGVYFPAADTIGLVEGGTEVVRINSSGNVGIGTTSPTAKLTVSGTTSISGNTALTSSTASTSTTTGALVVAGGLGVGGASFAGGTASAAKFSPTSGGTVNGTGLYASGSFDLTMSLNNNERFEIDNSGVSIFGAPGFNNAIFNIQNTLNYEDANFLNCRVSLIFNADKNNRYTSSGPVIGPLASIAAMYSNTSFIADSQQGAGALVFSTRAGTSNLSDDTLAERLRIDAAGNVGIGTTAPATRLHVDGTIRYTNRPPAATITAIGFDANGDLRASSSSLRYKHDIQNLKIGLEEVLQLRPVQFKFNGETRKNMGFIAEEVDELGLEDVLLYNEENQPEGVLYANMVSLLTKAIQEQQVQIEELKTEINLLKGI